MSPPNVAAIFFRNLNWLLLPLLHSVPLLHSAGGGRNGGPPSAAYAVGSRHHLAVCARFAPSQVRETPSEPEREGVMIGKLSSSNSLDQLFLHRRPGGVTAGNAGPNVAGVPLGLGQHQRCSEAASWCSGKCF